MKRESREETYRGVKYSVFGRRRPDYGVIIDDGAKQGELLKVVKPCPFCKRKADIKMVNTHSPYPWMECTCGAQLYMPDGDRFAIPRLRSVRKAKLVMRMQIDRIISHWNSRLKVPG